MRLDPQPLFRRIIMPWYDSTAVCWCLVVFMAVLVLFSIVGIYTALDHPAYRRYQIIPWVLAVLSLLVGISVSMRLIQRNHLQHRDAVEP